MKKWGIVILCAVVILSMVAFLGGCSSKPEAFSKKMRDNKACYVDVVEIQPDFEDAFIYCKCILADGSEVWMEVLDSQYKTYFDTNPEDDEIVFQPNGVTYETPVRLNGRAKRVTDVINNTNKKITVFRFDTADVAATTNSADQPYYAVPFSRELKVGKFVCADITKISYHAFVKSTTQIDGATLSGVTSVICRCTLTNGESMDILIDISNYKKYFDKGAVFQYDFLKPSYPDPIEFAKPVQIYGITINTKEEFSALSLMHDDGILFEFREAVAADIDSAKAQNQPAVPFSNDLKEKQPVYTEIESITPEYTMHNVFDAIAPEYYVCRCKTTDGKEIWLYIFSYTYETKILKIYGSAEMQSTTIKLETPIKINGSAYRAKNISDDLPAKIGDDMVIWFSEIA